MKENELKEIQLMAVKYHKHHFGDLNTGDVYFLMEDVWKLMKEYADKKLKDAKK